MPDKIDKINRLWRPAGAFAMVVNLFFLPPAIVCMAIFAKGDQHIPALIGLFATLGGWFVAMAGVRQIGKNKVVDANEAIRIAHINDDDD